MDQQNAWQDARNYTSEQVELARLILEEMRAGASVKDAVRHHPLSAGGYIGKHVLIHTYRDLTDSGAWAFEQEMVQRLRMKPMRTLSGVTTVTVLTKPHPCPGNCIFCPTEERMPKSYLSDEPGAMRALYHAFEPYEQTIARIGALEAIGHPTEKIELLILGATWSAYPFDYQKWFIQRCLDAMNGFDSNDLQEAQHANEGAVHKNVGLVVETRPDLINQREIAHLRELGVTKVQMGVQSLDAEILTLNKRGHTVEQSREAMGLLRAAGFKIVLHWMPNLLGATLESDRRDFTCLWDDLELRPDEIKIYPCQLLENTELHEFWKRGEYTPYTTDELMELIADLKPGIPRYCRVNRIIRDIPSTHIVEGNLRTSLRQDVQQELKRRGSPCSCIRCREVRGREIDPASLDFCQLTYQTGGAQEHFLSFSTPEDELAGYLRLSLPGPKSPDSALDDLENAAIIREVHVYGQSLELGTTMDGAAQHTGLGSDLMKKAEAIALQAGYQRIAVIAALGTRGYYRKQGYTLGDTYMLKDV